MKRLLTLFLLTVLLFPVYSQKKVYADYHGIRRTRLYDGEFGEWKYASKMTYSPEKSGVTQLTYNPDLILANGQHNIAAYEYPLVGMQSQYDPDNIEYQVLSAKTAGIDGFFVEWGYIDHTSNTLLQKIQEVAKKYDFEVGVNICDGWLMEKGWHAGTREENVEYFITCMQYLIDNVFTGSTAPIVNGKPVFYLFHDGFTAEEFKTIREHTYTYPDDYPVSGTDKFPNVIMRTTLNPSLTNDVYTPKSPLTQAGSEWVTENKVVPTPWMPERIRTGYHLTPKFHRYASADDCEIFLNAFATTVWRSGYPVKSGFVAPGMNNYGCGGWSTTGKLSYIPRDNGDTYERMWELNLKYKNMLNMIYIGSWNDYTEGHEIEPTVENGDRDLRMTLKYATQFKGETSYDESGITLPLELFKLRKKAEFFTLCGIDGSAYTSDLDKIAMSISDGDYADAESEIEDMKDRFAQLEAGITSESYHIDAAGLTITGSLNDDGEYVLSNSRTGVTIKDNDLKGKLAAQNYEGYMNFEYWDDTWGKNINIVSGTYKEPRDLFKTIAQLKHEGLGAWKTAKIRLYKENVKYGAESGNSDISFYGDDSKVSKIRNLSFDFTVYSTTSGAVSKSVSEASVRLFMSGKKLNILNAGENARLQIYNAAGGSSVCDMLVTKAVETVDLTSLSSGVYIAVIVSDSQYSSCKFIR